MTQLSMALLKCPLSTATICGSTACHTVCLSAPGGVGGKEGGLQPVTISGEMYLRSWCLPSTVCSRYVCRTGGAWGQGLLPPTQVRLMVTACSPAPSRCPPPCSAGTEGAVTSSLSLHPHLGKVPDELPLVVGQHVLNFLLAEGPGAQQPCFLQPQTPPDTPCVAQQHP